MIAKKPKQFSTKNPANFGLQQNLRHHADGQKNGNDIGQHKGATDLPPA